MDLDLGNAEDSLTKVQDSFKIDIHVEHNRTDLEQLVFFFSVCIIHSKFYFFKSKNKYLNRFSILPMSLWLLLL